MTVTLLYMFSFTRNEMASESKHCLNCPNLFIVNVTHFSISNIWLPSSAKIDPKYLNLKTFSSVLLSHLTSGPLWSCFQSTYRPWISLLLSCLWKIVDCVEIEFIAKILYTSSTPLPFLHGLSHLTSCALVIYFLLVQGEIIWSLPATSTNKVPTCYRVIFWSVALPSHQEVCRDGFLSVPFTFRIFHVMYIRLSSHTFRRVSTHHVHYWT